jgi:citrate synthase
MTNQNDGLEGVVAGTSAVSSVDGLAGKLTYRGIDIADLASNATFEEVAHLLWRDELPTRNQLDALLNDLSAAYTLPPAVLDAMCAIPPKTPPMDALRTGVSMLAAFDPDLGDNSVEATASKSVRLLAQVPALVATFARVSAGDDPPSSGEGPIAEAFLRMYTGGTPDATAARTLDVLLVLQADHELNASTFAARVIAATLSDIHSAVTGAIGALRGPLHGGANQGVMEMLMQIGSPETADGWVRDRLARRELIMGFGHRVYKTADPRATILRKMSRELSEASGHTEWFDTSCVIENVMMEEKRLNSNVDFFSATVYAALDLPVNLFTPLFAVSRTSGWTAHVLEQLANNRLIRPRAEYVGHTDRPFVPIAERS